MKVQVNIELQSACQTAVAAPTTFDLVISPTDTVKSVKDRISSVEPIAFPDQDLIYDGTALKDTSRLADYGVKDGAALRLVVRACEKAFAQQLKGLLQARALTPTELGLLYCHQHGVPVGQVLSALGYDDGLQDFVKRSKGFELENGCVVLPQEDVKPPAVVEPPQSPLKSIPEEVCQTRAAHRLSLVASVTVQSPGRPEPEEVEVTVNSLDTVSMVKVVIATAAMVPFLLSSELLMNGVALDDSMTLAECGVEDGADVALVVRASEMDFVDQLALLLQDRGRSINDLSLLYSCRYGVGVPRVLKLLGAGKDFPKFMAKQWLFTVGGSAGGVSLSGPEAQRYAAAMRALASVLEALKETSALDVHHVLRERGATRRRAEAGAATAEAIVFLNGAGLDDEDRWHPALLKATAEALSSSEAARKRGVQSATALCDSVMVNLGGDAKVSLRFAAVLSPCDPATA